MMHVVIEGYNKLGMTYEGVDKFLDAPERKQLRDYRHGTFHFTEQYFDPSKFGLYSHAGLEWMHNLYMAIGRPMLADLQSRKPKLDLGAVL